MKPTLIIALLVVVAVACGGADGAGPDTTGPPDPPPPPADGMVPAGWERGPVFVEETQVMLLESYPVQVRLRVTGDLPTPCHVPVWEVEDDGQTIAIDLASAVDPDAVCAEVLQPFDVSIPLAELTEGSRTVILNGEEVESFEL